MKYNLLVPLCLASVIECSSILISSGPHRLGDEMEASWRLGRKHNPSASLILECDISDYSNIILPSIQGHNSIRFRLPPPIEQQNPDSDCRIKLIVGRNELAKSAKFKITQRKMYGELIVLGYRDQPLNDRGKIIEPGRDRNAKYPFFARDQPNALVPDTSRARVIPSRRIQDITSSVVVQVDASRIVQIPCRIDPSKDMFQVGRNDAGNDFHVPGHRTSDNRGKSSRFAFRVVCDRSGDQCRLFAAGYDENQEIFLGKSAPRFISADSLQAGRTPEADGMISYGLMLWTPSDPRWREISVLGQAYNPRRMMAASAFHTALNTMDNSTNILEDGSVIVNACNGFMWRSSTASDGGWTPEAFNAYMDKIKSMECPVNLAPMDGLELMSVYPQDRRQQMSANQGVSRPCVFPNCGHRFNRFPDTYLPRKCPTCRTRGPVTELKYRYEPTISQGPPSHVLTCGHAMSEECASQAMARPMPRYNEDPSNNWQLPESSDKRACPFCGDLVKGSKKLYPEVE